MELLDLPYEQLLPIYKLCDFPDLISLACTSKVVNKSVAELLWHTVEIPWAFLAQPDFQERNLENFRHTKVLRFRLRNLRTYELDNWDALAGNFEYLVQHFDQEKLTNVDVEGVLGTEGLVMLSKSLNNLKTLTLNNCHFIMEYGWESLSHLKTLRKFRTNYPMCVGIIQHLAKMTDLEELVFGRQCDVSTEVLGFLPGLQSLSKLMVLDANQVKCSFVANNQNLSELTIESGEINAKILEDISSLPRLKKLGLVNCTGINQEMLSCLGQIELLETLHLVGNDYTEEGLFQFTELHSLKILDLGCSTNISERGLSYIFTLSSITHLYLYNCQGVTNSSLLGIDNLNNLFLLDISRCDITYTGIKHHVSKLITLRELLLDECVKLTDLGMLYVSNLERLTHLNVRGCSYITDTGLVHISKLTNLRKINLCMAPHYEDINFKQLIGRDEMDLQLEEMFIQGLNVAMGPEITDGGIFHLQALPLETLNLERCSNLTSEGLSYIGGMSSLVELSVSSCPEVDDEGIVHLCRLHCLRKLDISCTCVSDEGLSYVSQHLSLLRELDVSYCRNVTNVGVASVCDLLSFLKTVNISNCSAIDTTALPSNLRIDFINVEL